MAVRHRDEGGLTVGSLQRQQRAVGRPFVLKTAIRALAMPKNSTNATAKPYRRSQAGGVNARVKPSTRWPARWKGLLLPGRRAYRWLRVLLCSFLPWPPEIIG